MVLYCSPETSTSTNKVHGQYWDSCIVNMSNSDASPFNHCANQNCSRQHFYYFYFYLLKKITLDVSYESSAMQRIHMKYQVLFSLKNSEKIFMSSAAVVMTTLRVKTLGCSSSGLMNFFSCLRDYPRYRRGQPTGF